MPLATAVAVLATLAPAPAGPASGGTMVRIQVDAGRTRHTMASGIGASWHALAREIPLENEGYAFPAREEGPRGSAYGGNPPVSDTQAWDQIEGHARWLGLDFFRVELDQRMYQPERDRFDWDNEEMQALYRILDACERLGADVFLQQMWRHVEWNSFPGVHPLISAPRSLDDHARGLATLVEHLLGTKGYRCIRWLSIANEPPGGTWGYWWSYGAAPAPAGLTPITPALAALRKELDARGLDLPISAPDWTDLPPFPSGPIDFDAHVGAYDIHTYKGLDADGQATVGRWADWAREKGKPFLLTEFGNMALGWGSDDPGPASYAAVLSNAEVVIRAPANGRGPAIAAAARHVEVLVAESVVAFRGGEDQVLPVGGDHGTAVEDRGGWAACRVRSAARTTRPPAAWQRRDQRRCRGRCRSSSTGCRRRPSRDRPRSAPATSWCCPSPG